MPRIFTSISMLYLSDAAALESRGLTNITCALLRLGTSSAMDTSLEFSTLTWDGLEGVGLGVSSEVFRIRHSNTVAKIPALSPFIGPEVHETESKMYERIGSHPHILKNLDQSPPEVRS